MNDDRQLKMRRRLVVGIGVVFVVICVAVVVFYLLTRDNEKVVITNIDSCAERMTGARKDEVFRKLFSFVKEQDRVGGVETKATYHGVVRDETCTVKEYESGSFLSYNARFILDIEEAGYSYRVSFNWVKRGDQVPKNNDLGSVDVNCLLEADLIYGEFGCDKNTLIAAANSGGDPIMSLLPYFGDGYMLSPTLSATSASGYTILLTFDPPGSVYLGGDLDKFLEERRAMMREFLKENDIRIDDYELAENYKIVR